MKFEHSIKFETSERNGKSSLVLAGVYVLLLFGCVFGVGWLAIRQIAPKILAGL